MLRSEDGSAWWRDGGGNFNIPIPSAAAPDEGAAQVDRKSATWITMHVHCDILLPMG